MRSDLIPTMSKSQLAREQRLLKATRFFQKKFLAEYAKTGVASKSAKTVGISVDRHKRWLDTDPVYLDRFAKAEEESLENLEAEARHRAIEGDRQYKFTRDGAPIKHPKTGAPYFEQKKSDRLLMFLMKGKDPKWRDATDVGANVQVNVGLQLTQQSLDAIDEPLLDCQAKAQTIDSNTESLEQTPPAPLAEAEAEVSQEVEA